MTELERFFDVPENVSAYQEWVKDPITKKMHEFALAASRPIGMANPTGELALYLQGVAIGGATIIDFLQHAEVFAASASANNPEPDASFGAAAILEQWGVFPKRAVNQEK